MLASHARRPQKGASHHFHLILGNRYHIQVETLCEPARTTNIVHVKRNLDAEYYCSRVKSFVAEDCIVETRRKLNTRMYLAGEKPVLKVGRGKTRY
jgi:hypothetical protein